METYSWAGETIELYTVYATEETDGERTNLAFMGGDNGYNQFSQTFDERHGKNAHDLDWILRQYDNHRFRPTVIGSIFSDEERMKLAFCYAHAAEPGKRTISCKVSYSELNLKR